MADFDHTDNPYTDLAASLYDLDPDLAEGVLAEFRRGWQAEAVLTQVRQARVAEAVQRVERATVEGIGQHKLEVDATSYHYWGRRLGYQCWNDREFLREFHRDNPAARVKSSPRALTIVKSRDLAPATGPGIVLTDRRGAVVTPAA